MGLARAGGRGGFTLIELLIVVAIIAILAALAVPNFMEAQTRAKVSRARADFRAIETALECYRMDCNRYPKGNNSSRALNPWSERPTWRPTLERLSTPVAYLTGEANFYDPFKARWTYQDNLNGPPKPMEETPGEAGNFQMYWYVARNETGHAIWDQNNDGEPQWWFLESAGPDLCHHNCGTFFQTLVADSPANRGKVGRMIYDGTNGTVSRGSIWRTGGTPVGEARSFYAMVQSASR